MTVADAAAQLVEALEAADLRVAVRAGDITPPVCLVRIGTVAETGTTLTTPTLTTFWLYYIPIRGVDNLTGDAEGLDAIYAALSPLAWAELTATASSVTVQNDTWPCYRLDVVLAGGPDAKGN